MRLSVKFSIPVEKIEPRVVQIIGRELAPVVSQFFGKGLARRLAQSEAHLPERSGPFGKITATARSDDVFPTGHPPAGARDHVIKRQITRRATVLARKPIPQKKIKAREGHALLGFYEFSEDNDRRDLDLCGGASDDFVVFGNDIHPIKERRLDRILPRPKRQRVIREWSVIRV